MPVVGLGIDLCSVERIGKILSGPYAEKFIERVYTDAERRYCAPRVNAAYSYAARFAAKEALLKSLGAPVGARWRDMEVVRGDGSPQFTLSGAIQAEVERRRVRVWLSLTHDAQMAAAVVVLESEAER